MTRHIPLSIGADGQVKMEVAVSTDALKPGPELDALVAEKVMGGVEMQTFVCPSCGSTHFGTSHIHGVWTRHCHNDYCNWSGRAEKALPHYSSDIAAAWEIVDWWRNPSRVGGYGEFELRCEGDPTDGGLWVCNFGVLGEGVASTAFHAICLAALKAVEK